MVQEGGAVSDALNHRKPSLEAETFESEASNCRNTEVVLVSWDVLSEVVCTKAQ
jgi:hypothetical protein